MEGRLLPKIAWTNAIILVALLALAALALIVGDQQLADYIVGAIIGAVVGAGATTVVVQQHTSSTKGDSDTSSTSK